jgi:hypothetical protein
MPSLSEQSTGRGALDRLLHSGSLRPLTLGIAAIPICMQLYCTLLKIEIWPFSGFPMFSLVTQRNRSIHPVFYGVTTNGDEVELSDLSYWSPMDTPRLRDGAYGLLGNEPSPARHDRLKRLLSELLTKYEERRVAGGHHGQEIEKIRLYRFDWKWSEGATQPLVRKRLVSESAR